MYVYKYSVDIMCMIRLGLGGVLVVCEDFYNLDRSVLSPPPPLTYIHFLFQGMT